MVLKTGTEENHSEMLSRTPRSEGIDHNRTPSEALTDRSDKSEEARPKQCKAKSKQSGNRCKRVPAIGRDVCVMHGGKSAIGIASPQFKHGRYSRYMPADIRGRYGALVDDASLTQLRDEIAVVTVAIERKLERLSKGESRERWTRGCELWSDHCKLVDLQKANPDMEYDLNMVRNQLTDVLAAGRTTYNLFDKLYPDLELKRRLTETENRREKQVAETLSADEAMAFARQLMDAVKRNVSNPNEIAAIAADFDRALKR